MHRLFCVVVIISLFGYSDRFHKGFDHFMLPLKNVSGNVQEYRSSAAGDLFAYIQAVSRLSAKPEEPLHYKIKLNSPKTSTGRIYTA